jgi:hypothetical protein
MTMFRDVNSRMSILYRSLDTFKNIYQDFETKIGIWVSNDPMFEVDPLTFDYNLRLIYVPRWPLVCHAIASIICLGASACFHLFQIHSSYMKNFLQRMDFGGICILIAGSSYSAIVYNLSCDKELKSQNFFIWLITGSSIVTFLACMTP